MHQPPSLSEAQPVTQPAAQPGGKRRKNKKNKKKGPRPGSAARPLDIIEPGEPERAGAWDPDPAIVVHFKPTLEPEQDEPEAELSASAQELAALMAVPMAEWSEEQVLAWVELVELEFETRAALRTAFKEDDTDGEDLAKYDAKRLQKMLKKADLDGDLASTAEVVLALRDALLVQQYWDPIF